MCLPIEDFSKPLSPAVSSRNLSITTKDPITLTSIARIADLVRSGADAFTYANLHEVFYHRPLLLEQAVTHHFVAYKMHRALTAERFYEAEERIDLTKIVGKPPWDELNEWFAEADFPYRLEAPAEIEQGAERFKLRMRHMKTDDFVEVNDLSSGEASIVRFVLMMFAASKKLVLD